MRIAIITLPLHINYGGILQAYALQTVLADNVKSKISSPHFISYRLYKADKELWGGI